MPEARSRFGMVKDAVWGRLEKGLADKLSDPNLLKESRIELNINDWTITLDAYTFNGKESSRIRAPFVNNDGFKFKIFRKGFFTSLMKIIGMQDIEVGHPEFDSEFIIQGNNPDKVIQLFSSDKLRQFLLKQPSIFIQIKEDEGWFSEKFPKGIDELYLEIKGNITNIEQLQALFAIFANTLDGACTLDSASQG